MTDGVLTLEAFISAMEEIFAEPAEPNTIIMDMRVATYIREHLAAPTRRERWKAKQRFRAAMSHTWYEGRKNPRMGLSQFITNVEPPR